MPRRPGVRAFGRRGDSGPLPGVIPFLYNTALHALALPTAPGLYLWARWRHARFREALPHRLGRTRGLPPPPSRPPLWLHGVSLGEVRTLQPLVQAWHTAHPACPILISSSTATGLDAARSLYPHASVTPFPLDTPPAVNALLEYWRPGCVALLETELWPNFFWACARRQLPLCVVSGRISARTLRGTGVLGPVWRAVLGAGATFAMQTAEDAQRIQTLGAPADCVQVLGDLKWEGVSPATPDAGARWRATWGVPAEEPLLVWGSTHASEERLAARVWHELRAAWPRLRLVVVPRHPERFDAAAVEASGPGVTLRRHSAGPTGDWDVLVVDAVGTLTATYPAATVAVMGGTFAPVGGHNVLEPLAAGAPTLVGPHTQHIRRVVEAARAADAVVCTHPQQLTEAVHALLDDPGRRASLIANGRALLEANRGVAARLVTLIEQIWPQATACEP